MKDKATKPPFLTGFMIATENQTVNHTPTSRLQAFHSLPLYARGCESYIPMPSLGGDISGAKFWQVCFDWPKLLGQEAADFQIVSAPMIEIFLFPHA